MANTIMSAKNSFLEGLIMDFAPDNTQATCMTSALNATLLTFNGNEMSLLNDMGNARVETAYLPEGYVPVGSCEFGDIIYIVSYNPLTNKSLIGCFPSPERNISSEELYDRGEQGFQNISASDFLEFNGRLPTGNIKNYSVKKVLIDTKKLNPGDKYIIYSDTIAIHNNKTTLSDFSKEGIHNIHPSYVKLHIVSIEDSGKITCLDTDTKWYDYDDLKYYISSLKIGSGGLDSYRNLIQSNWSIFNSKVSGKLAILAELETIDTFSCSYNLNYLSTTEDSNIKYKNYELQLIPNHTSDKGLSPNYVCLKSFKFNNKDYKGTINDTQVFYYKYDDKEIATGIYDAIKISLNPNVNNWTNTKSGWEYEPIISVGIISIPYLLRKNISDIWTDIKSESFIFNLEVVPAMAYGRLEQFTIPLTINFNKVGTGDVSLNTWKYHNSGNTSILTYGIEAYPKPNWEVTDIIIQFYDNLGLVAEYLLNDKKYYSGTFTEYIGFNGENTNSRLTRRNSIDKETIIHKGGEVDKPTDDTDNYIKEEGKYYLNDAGILYSNFLYAAKIIVKSQHKDYDPNNPNKDLINISSPLYRWFWTNSMFNEYYYSSKDFKELDFKLILNGEAMFETTKNYLWKLKEINNLHNDFSYENISNTNSANIQYIGYGKENNINMYINAGLLNDYGCFNLIHDPETANKDDISGITLELYLEESEINYSIPEKLYEFSVKEENVSNPNYLALPKITNDNSDNIIADGFSNFIENPETLISAEAKDNFNIYFTSAVPTNEKKPSYYKTTLDKCYYSSESNKASIPLSILAILFNKAYVLSETLGTILVPVYTPIIDSTNDLTPLGLKIQEDGNNIKLGFDYAVALNHHKDTFSAARLLSDSALHFTGSITGDDKKYEFKGQNKLVDTASDTDFLNEIWGNINPNIGMFFPVYLGGYGSNNGLNGTKHYNAVGGSTKNYIPTTGWKYSVGKQDSSQNNSKLTNGSFDIKDGNLSGITDTNSTSFLGVKYKNGMTLINNAFLDEGTDTRFNQSALGTINFNNFAYLLFLLLTNTYHKNKKIQDQQIKLKNHVRNGDYNIELLKHIIIKLSAELEKNGQITEKEDMNISLRGINFKSYRDTVISHLEGYSTDNNKNVNLKLLSFAKDHELKILVKNSPMSFFNTDVEAYIRRLGILQPISNISPNNFYIYQNGELLEYSNGILTFPIEEVLDTLKYLFGKNLTLFGCKAPNIDITTKETLAYNDYINLINSYLLTYYKLTHFLCNNYMEAYQKREEFINNMFDTFPDSINGISKNIVRSRLETNEEFNNVFTVLGSVFEINKSKTLTLEKETIPANYYEFATHKFLSIFDYLNSFMTKSTLQLGNIFGIKDGASDSNSTYTGFGKDIMLDTNFLVV